MGICASTKVDPVNQEPTSVVPYSPHTPESVNKITPINVPSKEALMRLFNDYDLDGYVIFSLIDVIVLSSFMFCCPRCWLTGIDFLSLSFPSFPPALLLLVVSPLPHSNGHIEVEELVQMMTELKRATGVTSAVDEAKTNSDAVCVMKILDSDGNGTLEADEFVKWVQTGLKRPQDERNEVASMSQINRRMDNFLTSVSIVADELGQAGDGGDYNA